MTKLQLILFTCFVLICISLLVHQNTTPMPVPPGMHDTTYMTFGDSVLNDLDSLNYYDSAFQSEGQNE